MEDVLTIGIDPSLTNTGVVVCKSSAGGGRVFKSKVISPPKGLRGAPRLAYIASELELFIYPYQGALVFIEGYNYQGQNLAELGEASGVMKAVCAKMGNKVLVATPSQVKKFATGNSQASKEAMMEVYHVSDEHIADATALASIGYVYLTGKSQKRSELETVQAIKEKVAQTKAKRKPGPSFTGRDVRL